LGKERKFVWVVTAVLDIQFLHEQQVEKRGEELGRWNNKAG
jgi:hypothetical protein